MRTDGALTAVIGTVAGSLVLGGVGLSLWLLPCDDTAGLDCLGPAILGVLGAMAGFVLGSLLGCYVALRVRKRVRAGATVAVLFALGAVAGAASAGLAVAGLPQPGFVAVAAICWIGLPLVARWVVAQAVERARSRRSEGPVEI